MSVRRIARQGLAHLRAHTALVQLVGVLVCLPALLFPTYVPMWAIAGSLAGLVLLLAAGRLLAGRLVVRTPLDVTIVLLLLLLPISVLITPDRALTMPHIYKVIGSVALLYGVIGTLKESPWFGLSALAISALGVVLAALTLFGTEWTLAKFPWLPFDPNQLFPRLVRPFWNPQGFSSTIAGGTLAMLVPVPIAYLLFGRRPLTRLGALLAVGIVTPVLLFTQARGALVALAIGVGAMLATHDRRWLIVAALAGIVGAFAWRPAGVSSPVGAALDVPAGSAVHSAQGRLELWSRGWMMLQDFPFTGIGFGMVVRVMPMLYPTFVVDNDRGIEHVHNLYLQAGVDLGFPGLIATLAFLLGLCYLSWCAVRRARGTEMKPLASGMLGAIVVFVVHGFTDNITFYAKAHLIAWALFGVAVAVWQRLVGNSRPTAHSVLPGRRDGHEAA